MSRERGRDAIVFVAEAVASIAACGGARFAWVGPAIERVFQHGATRLPRFAALHKTSERLGHIEVLLTPNRGAREGAALGGRSGLTLVLFGAFAWRPRVSAA